MRTTQWSSTRFSRLPYSRLYITCKSHLNIITTLRRYANRRCVCACVFWHCNKRNDGKVKFASSRPCIHSQSRFAHGFPNTNTQVSTITPTNDSQAAEGKTSMCLRYLSTYLQIHFHHKHYFETKRRRRIHQQRRREQDEVVLELDLLIMQSESTLTRYCRQTWRIVCCRVISVWLISAP